MDWPAVDTVASWIGVGLSVLALGLSTWVRVQSDNRADLLRIQSDLDELRSFRDRMEGAGVLKRVVDLEGRQNATDTAMARLEQRLSHIDTVLAQIAGNVQTLLQRGGQ